MSAVPPNAETASTESQANNTTIQNAANANFISDATIAIQNAIALGDTSVNLNVPPLANIFYLQTYFQGLGYTFDIPNTIGSTPPGPAALFGEEWFAFWNGGFIGQSMPSRFVNISWLTPII